MPVKIPSHVFDIDEKTAERIIRKAIRKRRTLAAIRLAVATAAIVSMLSAIAVTI